MSNIMDGSCACGKIRFRLKAKPMFVHCCHCTDCQRQSGSAFALNAIIENDNIERLTDEPTPFSVPTTSGRPHDIYRCAHCHTAVWSDYGRRPNYRFVRIGTLENAAFVQPDVHIFTRSKQAWVRLPDGARAYEAFYELESTWPSDSLQRRKAAVGA